MKTIMLDPHMMSMLSQRKHFVAEIMEIKDIVELEEDTNEHHHKDSVEEITATNLRQGQPIIILKIMVIMYMRLIKSGFWI